MKVRRAKRLYVIAAAAVCLALISLNWNNIRSAFESRSLSASQDKKYLSGVFGESVQKQVSSSDRNFDSSINRASALVARSASTQGLWRHVSEMKGADALFTRAYLLRLCMSAEQAEHPNVDLRSAVKTPENASVLQQAAITRLTNRSVLGMCADIERKLLTPESIRSLLQAAASAGDKRAATWLVHEEMFDSGKPLEVIGKDGVALQADLRTGVLAPSAQQAEILVDAALSREPVAIRLALPLLLNSYADASLDVGQGSKRLDGEASHIVTELVACHYGGNCGRDASGLDEFCAAGRCDFESVAEAWEATVTERRSAQDWAYIRGLEATLIQIIDSQNSRRFIWRPNSPGLPLPGVLPRLTPPPLRP